MMSNSLVSRALKLLEDGKSDEEILAILAKENPTRDSRAIELALGMSKGRETTNKIGGELP
jgi:hypothetical protein